ncbi:MAG: LysR family transcriptional regulator [bacterium]
MDITLRQIKYFIAVAETNKISTAAKLVSISPSAITEAIKELESITGVKLITRHRRGVKLTFDGYRFLQHCRNITASVSNAAYALRNTHTDLAGNLRLAITFTVSGYFIAAPLARFRRTFPHIRVIIEEYKRDEIEDQLLDGKQDLAVLLTSNVINEELTLKTLVRSKRRLWTSTNHHLADMNDISLEDVSRFPYIQLMVDEASTTHMSYWRKHNSRPQIIFRTESVEAVRSMVAIGPAVAILSDLVYRPWSLEGDRIEAHDVTNEIPSMDVGLAWSKHIEINPCAQAFIDFCLMEFTSGRPRYGSSEIQTPLDNLKYTL